MSRSREQSKTDLLAFLRTIQRTGVAVESLGDNEPLVTSGLIDSLAVLQIINYLENTYGIDFSIEGVDPEQLGTVGNILDLIEKKRK